ncbi:MAG: HAD-IA family hydrolase [Chloroflexi bacterium]|nr:HAD-IA family hydrolase [Chloroflexota bacterium]
MEFWSTRSPHFQAWAFLAASHNIAFTEAHRSHFRGRQRRDCLLELFHGRDLTESEISAYLQVKDQFYLELLQQTAPNRLLLPHVIDTLQDAHDRNLLIGVASSSANARAVLRYVGLLNYMQVVADGSITAHSKPAPDIFIWTAGALGVPPLSCIVFEDSQAGVDAARNAGMFVVAVGAEKAPGTRPPLAAGFQRHAARRDRSSSRTKSRQTVVVEPVPAEERC